MRRIALLGCALVLVACSKGENTPAADSTAAVAPPPAPPMLMMSDVAGKWHVKVMGMASDSVLLEYDMTADSTGWTMMFPGRKDPVKATVMLSGDSAIADAGPYASALRKGAMVTTHGVSRIQGGELVGMTTAHYNKGPGDTVVVLRSRGTRTP